VLQPVDLVLVFWFLTIGGRGQQHRPKGCVRARLVFKKARIHTQSGQRKRQRTTQLARRTSGRHS
jgi:hypothetical protein